MTLTKERIEEIREQQFDDNGECSPDDEQLQLCDLALIGLAVQPRPIKEAPKDGSRILAWWDDKWRIIYWKEDQGPRRYGHFANWLPEATVAANLKPGPFIPLSALPKPREKS